MVPSPRRPWLVLAIAVAVVALPAAASGALSAPSAPGAAAANSATYQDSTGENAGAPDITTITVSNTDAGMLSFRVNIPNRPTLDQGTIFEIWVDSDNKTTTGSPTSPARTTSCSSSRARSICIAGTAPTSPDGSAIRRQ